MKKRHGYFLLLPVSILLLLISISCGKTDSPVENGKIDFISLTAELDTLAIMELTKVTATANGDNLNYTWKCDNELGIFEGSGHEVMFTICHAGRFRITCEVKDEAGNGASKDVYVNFVE